MLALVPPLALLSPGGTCFVIMPLPSCYLRAHINTTRSVIVSSSSRSYLEFFFLGYLAARSPR